MSKEKNSTEVTKTTTKVKKKPTFGQALIPIIFMMAILMVSLVVFETSAHIPIAVGAIFTGVYSIFVLGYTWAEIEKGMYATIVKGLQAVLIMMIIGMIVGTWIGGGIVPTMIYYGLDLLSPGFYLVATVLICSIVSLATGSSWTTAGTMGVALIGIAIGIGIPAPVAAGAILSGAYFGDKMSPLSDTTNLAPAMAGSNLFDHIKAMLYTTGPTYIIVLIIFGFMGMGYADQTLDTQQITDIQTILADNFTISPLMFIPPILVIASVILKVPAVLGLFSGVLFGALFTLFFQDGQTFGDVINYANSGFSMSFENATSAQEMVSNLLSRGGMQGMMATVSLVLWALAFGGVLEMTGMINAIGEKLLKLVKGTGSLVLMTGVTAVLSNILTADQYLSLVLPGSMFKNEYAKRGLSARCLSRTLEDTGTITSPLIPWNTCGAYMIATLGLVSYEYIFFSFFCWINPIISILFAYLGLFQHKMTPEEKAKYEASLKQEA